MAAFGLLPVALGCARVDDPLIPEATMLGMIVDPDAAPRLQVERTGSGAPLALIGGGLTGWASWQPHAERLAGSREIARLQLLSVEYGLEDRPLPPGYSLRMESRALARALDALGWTEPLDLVAWSYGAAITLDFALDHPERVRSLTLIEPPALWLLPGRGQVWPEVRTLEAVLPGMHDDVDLDALAAFVRAAALTPPGAAAESLPQWSSWVRHRRSLRNGRAVFTHADDPARLRAFTPPVLLVTGTGTAPFLRAVHDALVTALPNARSLELPGGHAPQLAAMETFLERLAEFHAGAATGWGRVQIVTSRDGTPIAFWRRGEGPPLLLVHGATADHTTTWRFVVPELERQFTVYALDRRGRGGSGDAARYELLREAEDVAAVVEAIGAPTSVVGHSYGALAAIEAALLTGQVSRLILYEGVPLRGAELYPAGIANRLEAMLEAGDIEGMLTAMFRELVEMPAEELELLRAERDAWAVRLRNARTLPRELRAEESYHFRPQRFASLRTPTLLLVGGDSPPREMLHAREVAEALPDARVVVLPGQQHAATYTAPELFVRELVRFLEGSVR